MTCRPPSSHGVRSLGIPLGHHNVTFVEMLRAAGYDTALIGKSSYQSVPYHTPQRATFPRRLHCGVPTEYQEILPRDLKAGGTS